MMHTATIRDSQDAPRKKNAASDEAVTKAPAPIAEKAVKRKRATSPLIPKSPAPPCKKRLAAARHRAASAEADRAALERNLAHRASSFTRSASAPAPSKLEQVRARIKCRLSVSQAEQL